MDDRSEDTPMTLDEELAVLNLIRIAEDGLVIMRDLSAKLDALKPQMAQMQMVLRESQLRRINQHPDLADVAQQAERWYGA